LDVILNLEASKKVGDLADSGKLDLADSGKLDLADRGKKKVKNICDGRKESKCLISAEKLLVMAGSQQTNLAREIGECVKETAKLCGLQSRMSQFAVAWRIRGTLKHHIVLLRRTSPCHCVLPECEIACLTCPLNHFRRGAIEAVKQEARKEFLVEMRSWPEFLYNDRTPENEENESLISVLQALWHLETKKGK
jgi:hypothetical protein